MGAAAWSLAETQSFDLGDLRTFQIDIYGQRANLAPFRERRTRALRPRTLAVVRPYLIVS